jgi:hypothetical protein
MKTIGGGTSLSKIGRISFKGLKLKEEDYSQSVVARARTA